MLTHNPPSEQVEGVTFVSDLASAVDQAKAAAGEKYVGVLGAQVGRQCIEAEVLDEVFVSIAELVAACGLANLSA